MNQEQLLDPEQQVVAEHDLAEADAGASPHPPAQAADAETVFQRLV